MIGPRKKWPHASFVKSFLRDMSSSFGHVVIDDMLEVEAKIAPMSNPRLLQQFALAADQGMYGPEYWSNQTSPPPAEEQSETAPDVEGGTASARGSPARAKSPNQKERRKVVNKKYDRSPDGHEARIAKVWGRELTDCEKQETSSLFKLQKDWTGIQTDDAKYGTWREGDAASGLRLTLGKDLANQIKAKNSPSPQRKKSGMILKELIK